jgi:hypothetical protein
MEKRLVGGEPEHIQHLSVKFMGAQTSIVIVVAPQSNHSVSNTKDRWSQITTTDIVIMRCFKYCDTKTESEHMLLEK